MLARNGQEVLCVALETSLGENATASAYLIHLQPSHANNPPLKMATTMAEATAEGPPPPTALIADLCRRIKLAIAPHTNSAEKPPFTEEELVIMALAMALRKERSLRTQEQICDWIIDTFYYYRRLARRCFVTVANVFHSHALTNPSVQYKDRLKPAAEFRSKVNAVFWSSEVELTCTRDPSPSLEYRYKVTAHNAEHLLRNIWPKDAVVDKPFPFFRLPPELRNAIYGMVLHYPESGILLRRLDINTGPMTVAVLDESPDHEFDFESWREAAEPRSNMLSPYGDGLLRAGRLPNILSLLLVNRQFHSEALKIFYGSNHFHFPRVKDFFECARGVAPNHLQHLTHVSIGYSINDKTCATPAFKILNKLKKLKRLDIEVDEKAWTEYADRWRGFKKHDAMKIENMRGLATFRRARADVVNFYGPCPTLEAMLTAEMTRPKKVEASTAKTRKRKVGGDGERKAKKAKVEKSVEKSL